MKQIVIVAAIAIALALIAYGAREMIDSFCTAVATHAARVA